MGHALLVYNNPVAGVNDANVDMTAATDADFSIRNGHYIFTNQFRLAKAWMIGASVLRARFQVPTWNALGEWQIFNVNRSLEPGAGYFGDNYLLDTPPRIPINEEFQVQDSNNLGAATEIENVGLSIITDDWSPQLPQGRYTFITRATGTTTWTLNAWSGPIAMTLTANLRGGVYAVIGAQLQADDAAFFRIVFPRYRLYGGQKLRPGWIAQNAAGNIPSYVQGFGGQDLGEWGRFHTFELPLLDVFGTAADSTAWVLYLKLTFLGEDLSALQSGLGGGGITI
jgi:hypothetical protein